MDNENKKRVNCVNCVHFAVTWEPKQPNSCKFYGFKTAQMPCVVVRQTSGESCMAFEAKNKK